MQNQTDMVAALGLDARVLRASLEEACRWVTNVAQLTADKPDSEGETRSLAHRSWRGAIRGEYNAATRRWGFFCPVWHTGQAVAALTLAGQVLGNKSWLLDSAGLGAQFIGAQRIDDPQDEDYGLICAYEDWPDAANVSAIIEALNGLFLFSDHGLPAARDWALDALSWIERKSYIAGCGLFQEPYAPCQRQFVPLSSRDASERIWQRPLLDDAVFLRGYRLTGRQEWRDIFFQTAEQLLANENPPGNWIGYPPCSRKEGLFHPRQAYWWGLPMIDAWQESGQERYLHCARRVAQWYVQAMRRDGGMCRDTDTNFNALSFGHATSGTACAAILFLRLKLTCGDDQFDEPLARAVTHCLSMQLHDTQDPNLRGAILEKVLPPDGTDRIPYYLRDLGTIFHIQAVARLLLAEPF